MHRSVVGLLLRTVAFAHRTEMFARSRARGGSRADGFEALEPRSLLATFTVASLADSGPGSLRQAILDANNNAGADIVNFDPAVTGAIVLTGGSLVVNEDLEIDGPGAGVLAIDGNHVSDLFLLGSRTYSLSGLTVRNGAGTGVHNSGTLAITNVTISGCSSGQGGGIYNDGSLTLTGSTLSGNTSNGSGGGAYNAGSLTVINSVISGNSALSSTNGGGIYSGVGSTLTITGSTISNNTAQQYGGGIASDGSLAITSATISGNTATTQGGGIYASASLTVSASTISGNQVGFGGNGAGISAQGDAAISNSTIAGNTAGSAAGGILFGSFKTATLRNSTISGNSAGTNSGGIAVNLSTLTMVSTIVAGNGAGGDVTGTLQAGSINNLIQDASHAGGLTDGTNGNIVGSDPLLSALANNGGPTLTMALAGNSPAIGHGSNPDSLATDQRGGAFARGSAPDIGAYQFQILSLTVDTVADTVDEDYSAGHLSLREAIALTNSNPLSDTITFSPSLNGQTITLGGTELLVTSNLTIAGPGADRLTINGNGASRIFEFAVATGSSVSGLTLTGGSDTSGSGGGAIYNAGTLSLTAVQISGNQALAGGGISSAGFLSIQSACISANTATDGAVGGGGILAHAFTTIVNSTIAGNIAEGRGGGVYSDAGTPVFRDVTIALNLTHQTAVDAGGGMYNLFTADVQGTLIAGNQRTGGASDCGGPGGFSEPSAFNLVQDGTGVVNLLNGANGNIIGVDPLLMPLGYYGGTTRTVPISAGSPAIGHGISFVSVNTDQRGGFFVRGSSPDIGAYQRQALSLLVDVGGDNDDGNYGSGSLTLREAITLSNANPVPNAITFAPQLNGISLQGTELLISRDVTITGILPISGNDTSRVFEISGPAHVAINGLTITGGHSDNPGGGIANAGTLTLNGVTVADNFGATSAGGIFNNGTLSMVGSTVSNNTAYAGDGGGILNMNAATISRSAILQNTAINNGGGICNSGTAVISQSTVSGNYNDTQFGGGLYNSGTLSLTSCTVARNSCNFFGAGVFSEAYASFTAISSIFAGNTAGSTFPSDVFGAFAGGSANDLVQDGGGMSGLTDGVNGNIVGSDPLLSAAADNGGPTWTMALGANSPAIGKGSNPNNYGSDQRGGPFSRGPAVDIGAYQRQSLSLVVDTTSDADDGDYSAGHLSLREAISLTNLNPLADTISFSAALNHLTITLSDQLIVSGDVAITGPGYALLTLSGGDQTRVFWFQGGSSSITGLTIAHGYSAGHGGAIMNAGTLAVANSVVSNSSAAQGGGIENSGNLALVGTTVSINTAGGDGGLGGGVENNGVLSLANCTVSSNRASYGGAISNFGAGLVITIDHSLISMNVARSGPGGGIYNDNGATLTVTNSTISDNSAPGKPGGGIFNGDATVTISGSTLSGNSSWSGGAIYNLATSMLTIVDSTLSGNSVDRDGGAIANGLFATAILRNSTVAQNVIVPSGGIGYGAGILNQGSLIAISTIIAGNLLGSDLSDIEGPLDGTSNHTLVQDASHSGGLVNGTNGNLVGVDPLLLPLTDNGGPTWTCALQSGSPAINKGSNPNSLTNDQRGSQRVRGLGIDIGAFELSAAPTISSLDGSVASVARGGSITLFAHTVTDADGTIARVEFYYDGNGNGFADSFELIGSDADPAGGYTLPYTIDVNRTPGTATFFAIAIDNEGESSDSATTSPPINVTDALPVIATTGVSAPAVLIGQSVTVSAQGVTDSDGTIARVDFYLDLNGNGTADSGELIGSDADAAGGYTCVLNTTAITPGAVHLLAVAIDNDGSASTPAAAQVSVVHPFGSYAGQLIGASAGPTGNLNITTQNGVGTPIILQEAGGASAWTGSDLQAKTGSPAITGELVTWVDPKDGLTYAAAMSALGLILFTATGTGTWGFRNLTTEVPGFAAITGNLTAFTSTDNIVSIAGVAASGDLIRYFQTGAGSAGNYSWTAVNHGDDLRAQGLAVPVFAGRITSFVTPWDALNVVGLDSSGHIQAIWWHASLNTGGKWTTNDLSAQTGAPALSGGLTVWLTSWNAINIAGTDVNGNLSATWWVPNFNNNQWNNSNLTNIIGGPKLEASSMTSWVTSWGAMNIAGRESDGTLGVYWWVPNYNNDNWNVVHFRDVVPTAAHTTGPVSGLTAPGGDFSMSILSTTASGDITRLWWSPSTNAWAEHDLTQIAVPA